jgi:hypothetical protein
MLGLFFVFFLWHYRDLNSGPPAPLCQPFFVMVFFEIGSHELFVWAGFKPQSS